MENQEKNQKGNQEYNQDHNQNNGLELLKKVIETNERNTEQGIKTAFVYEDLLNIKGETDYRDWETDRKSTRLNSSHRSLSRMPSSA